MTYWIDYSAAFASENEYTGNRQKKPIFGRSRYTTRTDSCTRCPEQTTANQGEYSASVSWRVRPYTGSVGLVPFNLITPRPNLGFRSAGRLSEHPGEQLGSAGNPVVAVERLDVLVDCLPAEVQPSGHLLLAISLEQTGKRLPDPRGQPGRAELVVRRHQHRADQPQAGATAARGGRSPARPRSGAG